MSTGIRTERVTKLGLACGAIAGPLFVAMFIFEGATRADYDPLRHPISSLAFGDLGWMQRGNFIVTGLLVLAFAIVADPLNGYPPGTPNVAIQRSTDGDLHDFFSALVFVGLPTACFVFRRRFIAWGHPGWARYSAVTGVAFVVAFVVTSAGFGQLGALADLAGLSQRITLAIGLTWLTLLAVYLVRSSSEADASRSTA